MCVPECDCGVCTCVGAPDSGQATVLGHSKRLEGDIRWPARSLFTRLMANKPQHSSSLCSTPQHRGYRCSGCTRLFLHGCCRSKLRTSCLSNSHFSNPGLLNLLLFYFNPWNSGREDASCRWLWWLSLGFKSPLLWAAAGFDGKELAIS